MAALRKALVTLFGGRGKLPKEEELDNVAEELFVQIRDAVIDDGGGDCITAKDLYRYLVLNSPTGISQRTVDTLYKKVDLDADGSITRHEFHKVIKRCHAVLTRELEWDSRMQNAVPDNYVIPGSTAMNARSGTQVFNMAVVRREDMKNTFRLFTEVDADGDGYITLPEFKRYVKRKQPHVHNMCTSIFYSLDKNRDGRITFKELLYAFYPEASESDVKLLMRMARPRGFVPHAQPDSELLDEIRTVFDIYDDNKSGSLDAEEFAHALTQIGFDMEEAAAMFKEIDRDGSGECSYEEFEFWYINNHRKQAKLVKEADRDSDLDEDHPG